MYMCIYTLPEACFASSGYTQPEFTCKVFSHYALFHCMNPTQFIHCQWRCLLGLWQLLLFWRICRYQLWCNGLLTYMCKFLRCRAASEGVCLPNIWRKCKILFQNGFTNWHVQQLSESASLFERNISALITLSKNSSHFPFKVGSLFCMTTNNSFWFLSFLLDIEF